MLYTERVLLTRTLGSFAAHLRYDIKKSLLPQIDVSLRTHGISAQHLEALPFERLGDGGAGPRPQA